MEAQPLDMRAPVEASPLSRLIAKIAQRREDALRARAEPYPRANPIASDLGPCAREMVLAIIHWKEKPLPNPELKARFERGSLLENAVLRELEDLGFTVRVERKAFEVKERNGNRVILKGKLDGFIQWNDDMTGHRYEFPLEVKSLDPAIFRQIATIEDFVKFAHMQKYVRQLQAYLLANDMEYGFFLLDDCMGHWKLIEVRLDYDLAESILKTCEKVVDHRDRGTLPDYIRDVKICNRCWAFGRFCTPPMEYFGIVAVDDGELEMKINRRSELKAAYDEYERLDKEIKSVLKNRGKQLESGIVIGEWLVTGREIHIPAQQKAAYSYWRLDIQPIQKELK
jgi:hypothetical protein